MLKFSLVPMPPNSPFQKAVVNLASLSETIIFGTPCSLTIYFRNTSSTWVVPKVDFIGMKYDAFVNMSTTTITESCWYLVLGNPVMKSIETVSHFHSAIGRGFKKPAGC